MRLQPRTRNSAAAPAAGRDPGLRARLAHALRNLPITRKLGLAVLLVTGSALLLVAAAFMIYESIALRRSMLQQMQSIAAVVGGNSVGALMFDDGAAAQRTLRSLEQIPQIRSACLYGADASGRLRHIASFPEQGISCTADPGALGRADIKDEGLVVTVPIDWDDKRVGALRIRRSLADLREYRRYQFAVVGAVLALGLVFVLLLTLLVRRSIVAPVLALAATARAVRTRRNFEMRAQRHNDDEIGGLVEDFNAMLAEVQSAQQEVLAANGELHDTLRRLELTQQQLVESEKMASLGGLVAGIAHEVNNPIGIGLTAASHLEEEIRQLAAEFRSGQLKRSTFEARLAGAEEMSGVILRHLRRAGELIQSFKRVAIDQSADRLQPFELGQYLHQIATSLRPELRKTPHTLSIECPDTLPMTSFPGALSQVLTNLIINALVHAFDERGPPGRILVRARGENAETLIEVTDDGAGIAPEHLKRVFDPFFTTKRGRGGSGLGLYLAYSLVDRKLRGSIAVDSRSGAGTSFRIRIPQNLEEDAHD